MDKARIHAHTSIEDISEQIQVIERNITKSEEWLEKVMTFRNNTSLSQEYLEDDLNVDFLEQTIKDLRDKSE